MSPLEAQILLDELRKLTRKFDEAAARWDQRFTTQQQPAGGCSASSCDDDSGAISVDALITSTDIDASLDADQKLVRCGPVDIEYNPASSSLRPASEKGVFIAPDVANGAELSSTDGVATSADEPRVDSLERIPAARVDAVVVSDNWGGLFEQTAQVREEQHADENQDLGECKPAVLTDGAYTWIRVDGGLTSSDPDAPASATPTPTPTPTPMEISPVQYQRQIQELEKPPSSPFPAAASEEEELRAIPSCGYVGSFVSDFAQAVEKKQVTEQNAESSWFLVVRDKQERHATIVSADGLGACGRVFIGLKVPHGSDEPVFVGVDMQRNHNDFAPDDPGPLCCVRLGPVECALRATLLGGYDGSLDDDPESGVAHFDVPRDRAVGRVGQAPVAAAALRADAIGAAGGGLLAWVVAAGSAQATCSTICPVHDRGFADVPVYAFWEEMIHWNDDSGTILANALARLLKVALAHHV